MQLSLSKMLEDVFQMLFIFMVTMLAFAVGMTRLLAFYKGMERYEEIDGDKVKLHKTQPERFDEYVHLCIVYLSATTVAGVKTSDYTKKN